MRFELPSDEDELDDGASDGFGAESIDAPLEEEGISLRQHMHDCSVQKYNSWYARLLENTK